MTNNSIWHINDVIPEDNKVFCYVNFSGYIKSSNCYEAAKRLDFFDKWIYLDDLIAQSEQSSSLKSENERLRKALEIAVEDINMALYANHCYKPATARKILKELRTKIASILETKDK